MTAAHANTKTVLERMRTHVFENTWGKGRCSDKEQPKPYIHKYLLPVVRKVLEPKKIRNVLQAVKFESGNSIDEGGKDW